MAPRSAPLGPGERLSEAVSGWRKLERRREQRGWEPHRAGGAAWGGHPRPHPQPLFWTRVHHPGTERHPPWCPLTLSLMPEQVAGSRGRQLTASIQLPGMGGHCPELQHRRGYRGVWAGRGPLLGLTVLVSRKPAPSYASRCPENMEGGMSVGPGAPHHSPRGPFYEGASLPSPHPRGRCEPVLRSTESQINVGI